LDYSKPVEVGYTTGDGMRQWMRLWDPWAYNTGWYWLMYDAGGKPDANLMGIFAGAPSRLIGAGGSGPGIYNRPGPDAGVTLETNLRGDGNSLFIETSKRTIRFAWGIYAGTRANLAGSDSRREVLPALLVPLAESGRRRFVLRGHSQVRVLVADLAAYPICASQLGLVFLRRAIGPLPLADVQHRNTLSPKGEEAKRTCNHQNDGKG